MLCCRRSRRCHFVNSLMKTSEGGGIRFIAEDPNEPLPFKELEEMAIDLFFLWQWF